MSFKKYSKITVKILVFCTLLFAFFAFLFFRFQDNLGLYLFSVDTSSMQPAINKGSLIVVRKDYIYRIGDVITYYNDSTFTSTFTHRIVDSYFEEDGKTHRYITKGDSNLAKDPKSISELYIVGKVYKIIPRLGDIVIFSKTKLGFFILVVIPASYILISEAISIRQKTKKKSE